MKWSCKSTWKKRRRSVKQWLQPATDLLRFVPTTIRRAALTEHRIGLTIYNLSGVMNGDLQEIMEALQFAENAEKLKEGTVA
jgi:hypothetical protein